MYIVTILYNTKKNFDCFKLTYIVGCSLYLTSELGVLTWSSSIACKSTIWLVSTYFNFYAILSLNFLKECMNIMCSLHQDTIYLYFTYFISFVWFSRKRKNILLFLKHWLLVVYVQQYNMNCCSWTWIQSWFNVQRFHLEIKWWHRIMRPHTINIRLTKKILKVIEVSFWGKMTCSENVLLCYFVLQYIEFLMGIEFWKLKLTG